MNKYILTCFVTAVSAGFISCSDDEEILTPTVDYIDNKFAVPDDATGPEADLRRDFYAKTGSYLIFSDLLSHEYQGTVNGQDIYKDEYIDFNYGLTSMGSKGPIFEFIEDMDAKRQSAQLIEDYIYPHIEGGNLMPFSILPVKNMQTWTDETWPSSYQPAKTTSCWRCMAIATGEWLEQPDDEAKALYSREILKALVQSRFSYSSDEAKPFTDLSYEYSGEYITDLDPSWDRTDMSIIYEYGFLSYRESWRGPQSDYLVYTSKDFEDYFNAVLDMEQSEFMELYGEYEAIVEKYNLIREAIISLGYKF